MKLSDHELAEAPIQALIAFGLECLLGGVRLIGDAAIAALGPRVDRLGIKALTLSPHQAMGWMVGMDVYPVHGGGTCEKPGMLRGSHEFRGWTSVSGKRPQRGGRGKGD
jgi:hypothetical protein